MGRHPMRSISVVLVFTIMLVAVTGCSILNSSGLRTAVRVYHGGVDISIYPKPLVRTFRKLASGTAGKTYYSRNAGEVDNAILEIVKKHVRDRTDLVFMIDKTGSMRDDINEVRRTLNDIISSISKKGKVRLGAATYGDREFDRSRWYDQRNLTMSYGRIRAYINSIETTGGGDPPESVYDGLWNVAGRLTWLYPNRVVIVIGDAPPHERRPKTRYTYEQVIRRCKAKRIKVYPILVK